MTENRGYFLDPRCADIAADALLRVEVERQLGARHFGSGSSPERVGELGDERGDGAVVRGLRHNQLAGNLGGLNLGFGCARSRRRRADPAGAALDASPPDEVLAPTSQSILSISTCGRAVTASLISTNMLPGKALSLNNAW